MATAEGAIYNPISNEWEFNTCAAIRFDDRGGGERMKARTGTVFFLEFRGCGLTLNTNKVIRIQTCMQSCEYANMRKRQNLNMQNYKNAKIRKFEYEKMHLSKNARIEYENIRNFKKTSMP